MAHNTVYIAPTHSSSAMITMSLSCIATLSYDNKADCISISPRPHLLWCREPGLNLVTENHNAEIKMFITSLLSEVDVNLAEAHNLIVRVNEKLSE